MYLAAVRSFCVGRFTAGSCDNNIDPPCLQKGQDDVWPESEEEEKESQYRLGLSK